MDRIFGMRIKELRNSRHFTQEEVAAAIGMSRQRYARIEKGITSISLEILAKIARVFDVAVGDITKVLDESSDMVAYRKGENSNSAETVFEMLDLFYANKHMFMKLQNDSEE